MPPGKGEETISAIGLAELRCSRGGGPWLGEFLIRKPQRCGLATCFVFERTTEDASRGMNKKTANTRFRPGESGNPGGRPKGSRNKATLAMEALLDGEGEEITRKAIELAKDGDMGAIRVCMDRIAPPRRQTCALRPTKNEEGQRRRWSFSSYCPGCVWRRAHTMGGRRVDKSP